MSKIRILVASLLIFCLVTFITLLIVIGVSDCVVLPVDAAVRDFAYSIRGEKYGQKLLSEVSEYIFTNFNNVFPMQSTVKAVWKSCLSVNDFPFAGTYIGADKVL